MSFGGKTWLLEHLIILIVLLPLCAVILRMHRSHVGDMYDDGVYIVSAQGLHSGLGYILPSRPTEPPAQRYPIGLPILLAAAWAMSPWEHTLQNDFFVARLLILASWLLFFYFSLAWLKNVGVPALFATPLMLGVVLHPAVLQLTVTAVADVPFAAATAILIWRWTAPGRLGGDEGVRSAFWDGLISGAAMLLRSNGVSLVLGSLAQAWLAPKKRALALLLCSIGILLMVAPFHVAFQPAKGADTASHDYVRIMWDHRDPSSSFRIITANAGGYARSFRNVLAPVFYTNTMKKHPVMAAILSAAIASLLCLGLWRWRNNGFRPIPIAAHVAGTGAMALVWPPFLNERLWMGLMPAIVLLAGLGAHSLIRRKALLAIPLGLYLVFNATMATVTARAMMRVSPDPAIEEALSFLKTQVESDAVIIADFPEMVYLHTGRQAVETLEAGARDPGSWDNLNRWMARAPGRKFYLLSRPPDLASDDGLARQAPSLLSKAPVAVRERFRTSDHKYWIVDVDRQ